MLQEVLLAEESDRSRGFALSAMLLAALVTPALPWLGGALPGVIACAVGSATVFLTGVFVLWRTRGGRAYDTFTFRVVAWSMTTAVLGPEYYLGFFSPVTVVLSLGIYFMAQSHDRVTATASSLWATFGWLGGGVLVMTGQLPNEGLFPAPDNLRAQAFILVAVTAALLATLQMGSLARDSLIRAIKRSNQAALLAQRQAAQLAEARNQLARAMRLALGKPGQHTGRMAGDATLGVLIGIGAMGEVYEGTDEKHERQVAVKLLHDANRQSPDVLERFLREADICRQLDHPNLARVHAVGTLETGDPFLSMERLSGEDLGALLRDVSKLTTREVVEMCEGVAQGLAHAHAGGFVHRDLKPHNIFRVHGERGPERWKILDFGISRHVDSSGTLTQGGVVGTPAYMSPEQTLGQPVDQRSDVFALAAVAYRSLTGQPAFPGTETPRIMFDVAYRQPEQPSSLTRSVSDDVNLVMAIGLSKDPDLRFASAPEFAQALRQATKRTLSESLRARGRSILRERPWGSMPAQADGLVPR